MVPSEENNEEFILQCSSSIEIPSKNKAGDKRRPQESQSVETCDIMCGDDDPEPKSVIDCQDRPDWDKWKDAMQAELKFPLNKRKYKEPYMLSFAVNLLARFSSSPTKRHWNGIKHIFRYLRGTTDLGLFYSNNSKQRLVGYVDAGYLSDPHKARSQTGYVFLNKGIAISCVLKSKHLKQHHQDHAEVICTT
ncbi:hypothetical protein Tco_0895548 [Tanacetum coccineum]|uniref:Reverse transcriptase Ty1/copia-type domain-containing protein n=1 Tax=Tanacetum coccineum TaxID=301880 RepID=A0ABQ5CEX0_9ASTR